MKVKMATSELSRASRDAINQVVQAAIKEAFPKVHAAVQGAVQAALDDAASSIYFTVTEHLRVDADGQISVIAKQEPRAVTAVSYSTRRTKSQERLKEQKRQEQIKTATVLRAQMLQMDDSTTDKQIKDWFESWAEIDSKIPRDISLGFYDDFIEYWFKPLVGIPVGAWLRRESHPNRREHESAKIYCLCRAYENNMISHTAFCGEGSTSSSSVDEIGRFFVIGELWACLHFCRYLPKPKRTYEWYPMRFKVVKSLTEGGIWIVADEQLRCEECEEALWSFEPPCPCNHNTICKPANRRQPLPRFGEISYARLSDHVQSLLYKVYEEVEKESEVSDNDQPDGEVEGEAEWCAKKFDIERQYEGGFAVGPTLIKN